VGGDGRVAAVVAHALAEQAGAHKDLLHRSIRARPAERVKAAFRFFAHVLGNTAPEATMVRSMLVALALTQAPPAPAPQKPPVTLGDEVQLHKPNNGTPEKQNP